MSKWTKPFHIERIWKQRWGGNVQRKVIQRRQKLCHCKTNLFHQLCEPITYEKNFFLFCGTLNVQKKKHSASKQQHFQCWVLPWCQQPNPSPQILGSWVPCLLVPWGSGQHSPSPPVLAAVLTSEDSVLLAPCSLQTPHPQREAEFTLTTPLCRGWTNQVQLPLASMSCSDLSFPNGRRGCEGHGNLGASCSGLQD